MDPKAFVAAVMSARACIKHGDRPTDLHVTIARKLAFWRGRAPSHQELANAAHTSRRTVIRALARLRELGLLTWTRRVVCGKGWRAQVSNAYDFTSKPLSYLRLRTSAMLSPPAPAPVLAEIAARRTVAMAENWTTRDKQGYRAHRP
jgi:DNA-binding transcriptional MocR family regulator